MTPQSNPSRNTYRELLDGLLVLDRKDKSKVELETVIPHFFRIQSLLRCTIEHVEGAVSEARSGRILPAMALTRSAFDHVVLASYLHKLPNGSEAAEWIVEKKLREFAENAMSAGATESAAELFASLDSEGKPLEGVRTKTWKIIQVFEERKTLELLYYFLSQAVHPQAAFSQYVDLDETTGERRIRRKALDQDSGGVEPFICHILAIALLLDADVRNDYVMRERILVLIKEADFSPEINIQK